MGRLQRERKRKKRIFISLLLSFVLLIGGFYFTGKIVKPAIESIGEINARAMVVQTVNEVIRDEYTSRGGFEDVLNISTDAVGKVTLVQANSAIMNRISYELAWEIQREIKEIKEEKILIPIGSILGNQILSQTGPKVNLKVLPLGATKIHFNTELTQSGINQTKYKVFLDVVNVVKVIVPFSNKQIQVDTSLLVAEAVIVGDIPESYIIVPKDDIMDAVNP